MALQRKASQEYSNSDSVPTSQAAKEEIPPKLQTMFDAVRDALIELKGGPGTQASSSPQPGRQQPPESQGSGAHVPTADKSDPRMQALILEARTNFEGAADSLDQFIGEWADHLESLGCSPADALTYLHLSNQILTNLYFLAARQANPSPTEMRQLALRYALDARRPIDCYANHYFIREEASTSSGEFSPSGPHDRLQAERKAMRIEVENPLQGGPNPIGLVKQHSTAFQILGCVAYEPPLLNQLLSIIERRLGCVLENLDSPPPLGNPLFHYEIDDTRSDPLRVRLWINDREVPLPNWRNVHSLLHELCIHPGNRYQGRDLEKRLEFNNASQAVTAIRAALGQIHPELEGWLCSNPIGWADGCRPTNSTARVPF